MKLKTFSVGIQEQEEGTGGWNLLAYVCDLPKYGEKITTEVLSGMEASFKNNVLEKADGTYPVFFGHATITTADRPAAGWIHEMEVRGEELWGRIVFTEGEGGGKEAVKTQKYKFLSIEFYEKWKDPKTGDLYNSVFSGAALTNEPKLPNMPLVTAMSINSNLTTFSMESLKAQLEKVKANGVCTTAELDLLTTGYNALPEQSEEIKALLEECAAMVEEEALPSEEPMTEESMAKEKVVKCSTSEDALSARIAELERALKEKTIEGKLSEFSISGSDAKKWHDTLSPLSEKEILSVFSLLSSVPKSGEEKLKTFSINPVGTGGLTPPVDPIAKKASEFQAQYGYSEEVCRNMATQAVAINL